MVDIQGEIGLTIKTKPLLCVVQFTSISSMLARFGLQCMANNCMRATSSKLPVFNINYESQLQQNWNYTKYQDLILTVCIIYITFSTIPLQFM